MLKKLWKSKGTRVWFFVSVPVILLFAIIFIISSAVPVIYNVFNMVMPGGGPRAIYQEGIDPIYTTEYENKAEVHEAARAVNEEICEEGFVLLKNKDSALPLYTPATEGDKAASAAPKISVFGKNSVNLAYGGSGSGGTDTTSGGFVDLYAALEDAGYDVNPTLKSFYEDDGASGAKRKGNSKDLDSGDTVILTTAETPQSKYTQAVKDSYADYNDMALIVITRIGGEGFDMPRLMTRTDGDGKVTDVEGARAGKDDHFLQLDQNESDMVKAVCDAGFDRVVVVLNTGQAIETGFLEETSGYVELKGYDIDPAKIDAAIWMGFPGETGTRALGSILNGNVNPSGKLADTYSVDFKADPTWLNFGDNRITARGEGSNHVPGGDEYVFDPDEVASHDIPGVYYYFVDYEESIYYGYRYYETRGAGNEEWYNDNVVYPFGHGLSYTDFTWTADFGSLGGTTIDGKTKYTVTVTVHNDGDVAGKDVVQLYGHAPYTAGGVEKSEVVLLDFAKTELIEPGEDAEVTLTFDPYLLASYDYSGANDIEGTGYELDGGDGYALYVAENAHDRSRSVSFSVPSSGIKYDKDPVTGNPVVNRYTGRDGVTDSDAHLGSILSRNAWEETWPAAPSDDDRKGSAELLAEIASAAHNNPNDYESEAYPVFGAEVTVKLRDLLPEETPEASYDPIVPYNDERWDSILDACDPNDLIALFNYGAYQTRDVLNIGLPETISSDGPSGFTCFMDRDNVTGTCHYCSEPVMASTWNVDLIREIGNCMGEEGMWGSPISGTPYSAIYAPGANIHRSQFGGRCSEYFSEDPVISGKMSAAIIKGCQERGVACTIKHFVANEQETHRSNGGNSTWLTEQALRELYLKPFEIAVKESGSRALMSSFNRIGTKWTGGDYRLLTEILREEWGFRGYVICDFNTCPDYMFSKQMAYAGGDINLSVTPVDWCNQSSTSDMVVLRRCAKNLMYALVNSNAMNGEVIGYKMPIWQILVIVADCVIVAGLSVWGFFAIRKALKAPDKTPDEAGGESKQ